MATRNGSDRGDRRSWTAGILVSLAAIVVGALWPATADASSVSTRSSQRAFDLFLIPGEELVYVAAPGEHNRVVVRSAYAGSPWTVSDPGAMIEPGPGCVAVDAHSARCVATSTSPMTGGAGLVLADAQLGDLDDEIGFVQPDAGGRFVLVADGGAGNDRLSGSGGVGGVLRGGPGDDRLFSRTGLYDAAVLDGGGGRDVLRGGLGTDTVSDGDLDDAVGDAAPGSDVLDGGGGEDTVSYRQRTVPVSVDIADSKADGARGEGDEVRNIESIVGGQGDDRLAGDGRPNLIDGQDGRDVLRGRGGGDDFVNGRGPIFCGAGDDLVRRPRPTDFLGRGCENVTLRFFGSFAAYPTIGRAGQPSYRIHCQEDFEGQSFPCSGAVTIMRKVTTRPWLARGTFPEGVWRNRRVALTLTPLGRRLASTGGSVAAIVKLRIDEAALSWSIRLTLPRRT
jgi:hypothetical protein